MSKTKRLTYPIEEQNVDRYASLEMAQEVALSPVALAIAQAVRTGVESGRFAVEGRMITTNGGDHDQERDLSFASWGPRVGLWPR